MIDKNSKVPETHHNPLIEQTPMVRIRQQICKNFGCVTTSSYYVGMPQAHCCRCGKMTNHADKRFCEPWQKPTGC